MTEKEGTEKDIEISKEIIEIKKGIEEIETEIEKEKEVIEKELKEKEKDIEIWKEKEKEMIGKEGIRIMKEKEKEKEKINIEKEINYLLNYEVIEIFSFIFYVMENEILFKWLLEIELQCNVFIVYS